MRCPLFTELAHLIEFFKHCFCFLMTSLHLLKYFQYVLSSRPGEQFYSKYCLKWSNLKFTFKFRINRNVMETKLSMNSINPSLKTFLTNKNGFQRLKFTHYPLMTCERSTHCLLIIIIFNVASCILLEKIKEATKSVKTCLRFIIGFDFNLDGLPVDCHVFFLTISRDFISLFCKQILSKCPVCSMSTIIACTFKDQHISIG